MHLGLEGNFRKTYNVLKRQPAWGDLNRVTIEALGLDKCFEKGAYPLQGPIFDGARDKTHVFVVQRAAAPHNSTSRGSPTTSRNTEAREQRLGNPVSSLLDISCCLCEIRWGQAGDTRWTQPG